MQPTKGDYRMNEATLSTANSQGYTPEERRWKAEDPDDPRADCPQREQHAHRMYGRRWSHPNPLASPRIDGQAIGKTHSQLVCEGCRRYMVWLPKGAT